MSVIHPRGAGNLKRCASIYVSAVLHCQLDRPSAIHYDDPPKSIRVCLCQQQNGGSEHCFVAQHAASSRLCGLPATLDKCDWPDSSGPAGSRQGSGHAAVRQLCQPWMGTASISELQRVYQTLVDESSRTTLASGDRMTDLRFLICMCTMADIILLHSPCRPPSTP